MAMTQQHKGEEEEEVCPVCKSDRYLTPKMVLMVSPCYHLLCDSCVYRLFLSGSAPCPQCGTILRKSSFHVPTFDDLRVEKECRIRKYVARCLNKREADFENARAYNDYLEQVEEMVFKLVNDVQVEETKAQLDAYRRENAGLIKRNLDLEEEERRRVAEEKALQEEARIQRDQAILDELEEEERARREKQSKMVDDLIDPSPTPIIKLKAPTSRILPSNLSNLSVLGLKRTTTAAAISEEMIDPLETVHYCRPEGLELYTQQVEAFFGREKCRLMTAGGFDLSLTAIYLRALGETLSLNQSRL